MLVALGVAAGLILGAAAGVAVVSHRAGEEPTGNQAQYVPAPRPTSGPESGEPDGTYASGLPWSDGAHASHSANDALAFQEWRGRPLDNISVFLAREAWENMLNTWWKDAIPDTFDPATDDLNIALPLWTEDDDLGADWQWRRLGAQIADTDPDAIVRLGWEFNCCFSKHEDSDFWKRQYIRAAGLMLEAAPDLHLSWVPNEGRMEIRDPENYYPGDEWVDSIGIDAYDWNPPYTPETWPKRRDSEYSWNWWYDFAQERGKPFALGEWGLIGGEEGSGGDNAYFLEAVYGWLRQKHEENPGSIRYATYFNFKGDSVGGRLWPTDLNPKGAAEYLRQVELSAAGPPSTERR